MNPRKCSILFSHQINEIKDIGVAYAPERKWALLKSAYEFYGVFHRECIQLR